METIRWTSNFFKKILYYLIMLMFSLVISYIVAEVGTRVLLTRLPTHHKFKQFSKRAKQKDLTLREYGEHLVSIEFKGDMVSSHLLGWNLPARVYQNVSSDKREFTILFIGDSVTQGEGVKYGEEDYPFLLFKNLNQQNKINVKIINAGVHGYGVDQMLFKTIIESKKHKPNLIIFSYIPHDLLRSGTDFLYGRSKSKIKFNDNVLFIETAKNSGEYYFTYEKSIKNFTIFFWYMKNIVLPNIEYYLPWLYGDYYKKIYQHIYNEIMNLSKSNSINVVFVKLTNTYEFYGKKFLDTVARNIFDSNQFENVYYYDTERCVKKMSINLKETLPFHPGPLGHSLYAECLTNFIATEFLNGEENTH